MNNIFFRIYGGMLASLIVVGLLSFLTLEVVYNNRNEAYRDAMSKGTFRIVADTAARLEGDGRVRWIQRVNQLLGAELRLARRESVSLTAGEVKELESGAAIVNTSPISNETSVIVMVPDGKKNQLISAAFEKVTEQQARGSARLVINELGRFPMNEWDNRLQQLERYFGFPLEMVAALDLNLDSAQFSRLRRGEVIVVLDDAMSASSVLRIVAPLPKNQDFLVLGPLALFDWFPYYLMIFNGFVAFFMVGLASYLLVRPLQSRLRNMESAVNQIRRGDLSVRVIVESHDALGQLGSTLNDMAEHIQRLIRSQREMTHAVSHELRTPVARIRFGLEMLECAKDDEARAKKIKEIDGDIEELNTLVDEILTYATLEEGRPALNFEMVDIDAVIKQVRSETEALGTKIVVEHILCTDRRRMAECEARYIHRVIQNLVGNAIRYANSKVRVGCSCEGGMYRIDIEDDGPGIPRDQWDRVFVPFARLDDSRTRSSGGYGLGLSIVQRIAYWHGGLASVYKSELGGAKFTIIWPRTQSLRKTVKETLPEPQLRA